MMNTRNIDTYLCVRNLFEIQMNSQLCGDGDDDEDGVKCDNNNNTARFELQLTLHYFFGFVSVFVPSVFIQTRTCK